MIQLLQSDHNARSRYYLISAFCDPAYPHVALLKNAHVKHAGNVAEPRVVTLSSLQTLRSELSGSVVLNDEMSHLGSIVLKSPPPSMYSPML